MPDTHRTDTHHHLIGLLLLTLGLTLSGCGKSGETTPEAAAGPASQTVDANSLTENDGVIEVPDGTPDELFAFMEKTEIDELGSSDDEDAETPAETDPAKTQAAQGRAIRRVMRVRLEACDKILARQNPEETRTRAIRLRLEALRTLAAIDPDHYLESFNSYLNELLQGSDQFLARMAKATQFQGRVNDLVSNGGENAESLLEDLKGLLADPDAGPELLDATRDAMGWLFQSGQVEVASEGFRLIGRRFETNSEQDVADEAKNLVTQSTQINLTRLTQAVSENQEGAVDRLMSALKELLAKDNTDEGSLPYAMQTALFFEFTGRFEQAKQTYEMIRERYADDADTGRGVELALKRINLVGTELSLQGVQLNGQAFDWTRYRGKWTVVCFWTTWHDGWLQFAAEIRDAITREGKPIAEVVAINLDDKRSDVEKFIGQNPTSWTILVNADPQALGFENPNAIACGIEAVPFVLLVDPAGKVVATHLVQQRLVDVIEENVK